MSNPFQPQGPFTPPGAPMPAAVFTPQQPAQAAPQYAQPMAAPGGAAPPPAGVPAQYPHAAPAAMAAPQYTPGAGGLDDPSLYSGFNTPLFPNVAGTFDLDVVGFAGNTGHVSGPAIHLSFVVVSSTDPAVQVGSTQRIFYKYDYARNMPTHGDQGKVHASLLGQFIAALYNRDAQDPTFQKAACVPTLLATDWTQHKARVQLRSELRPANITNRQTRAVTVEMRRREFWCPPGR